MNILSWNCQGLRRSQTVQELVCLVRIHSPKIVFLSKTRQSDDWVRNLRWRLELQNCLTIKGEGKGGGVALFWDEGLTVDLQSMGEHHIDVLLKMSLSAPWLMIGDSNEAMWSFEHFSSTRRRERQMLDFWEVLSYCELYDIGFSGIPWTYDNKQEGEHNHLVSSRSDHCPILLMVETKWREPRQRRCMRLLGLVLGGNMRGIFPN
uniref:Endonuclease/exonuclease/phosphatase domain-containing protein n=1 Tax=Setaria viridis TaxID=4556 RepID=A0A4U6UHA0_SETVI|nr:hypothetical protein SEVIR_6G128700v2 [Setaria viridis]